VLLGKSANPLKPTANPTAAIALMSASPETTPQRPPGRYAVITAYYKEPRATLERCIDSVKSQTVRADHLMVADGFPQDWVDGAGVRHLRLDRAHGDYGNTPRAMGGLLAIAEQYDGLCFLDGDNWLEPNHVEECLGARDKAVAQQQPVDYVIARRNFCRPDGSPIPVEQESITNHVDTSCFFFFPPAFHVVPHFGMMPKELSAVGDRFFYNTIKARGLRPAICEATTVNYSCIWEIIYRNAGEEPPPGCKPVINTQPIFEWLAGQPPEKLEVIWKLTGSST
jgi:hypothetical protein